MGAISSCFGRAREPEENDDETRRLLQDPYRHGGYGGTNNLGSDQPDSEAARREREALEGIYHSLSDVLDVFTSRLQNHHSMSADVSKETGSGLNHDEDDLASEEMRLRTIKKGRSGLMFRTMDKSGMDAVQAAIG